MQLAGASPQPTKQTNLLRFLKNITIQTFYTNENTQRTDMYNVQRYSLLPCMTATNTLSNQTKQESPTGQGSKDTKENQLSPPPVVFF